MSCHELYEYTCQYKFSGNGNKEFYHSFYCWRESSFLIHTNTAFPLLLTKALAMLQSECYYKIFYYSIVNIRLSFSILSTVLQRGLYFDYPDLLSSEKNWLSDFAYWKYDFYFSWKSSHTPDYIVMLQTLLLPSLFFTSALWI